MSPHASSEEAAFSTGSRNVPEIVVIPGACSPSDFYHPLIQGLKREGIKGRVYDLPGATRFTPERAATYAEDVAFFNGVIAATCSSGTDVLVLAHSYGGCVASDAIKGLTEAKPGRGKVRGVIYMAAAVPRVGDSLGAMMAHLDMGMLKPEGEYVVHRDFEASAAMCFSGLPLEEGLIYAKRMLPQSQTSYTGETQYAAYRDVEKIFYIRCSGDKCLPPDFQEVMINNAKSNGTPVEIFDLDGADHCPNVSKPDDVNELVTKIIKTRVG